MTTAGSVVAGNASRDGFLGLVVLHRWMLLITFVACGLVAYLLSDLMRRAYRAEALVIPVQSTNAGLAGGLSSLVGAAALTNLGLAPAADKNEAIETLQSRALIREFIEDHKLLPTLCQSKAIDCHSTAADVDLSRERQMHDAVKLFRDDLLAVNEDTISGAIHVSLVWYDRVLAADWCNSLIELANHRMQDNARTLAAKRVKFLQQEYEHADIVAVQLSITNLMQTELSRAMDASTRPEYALRVVDAATAPDDRLPVRPRKAIIGAVGGLLGFLVALTVAGVRRRRTG